MRTRSPFGLMVLFTFLFLGSLFLHACHGNLPTINGSQTATPTATATPGTAAVYIYSTDPITAAVFQTLLSANGYSTTLVNVTNATSVDYSNYSLIVIGYDTNAPGNYWSGTTALANQLITSGKPIVGMQMGGLAFFGRQTVYTFTSISGIGEGMPLPDYEMTAVNPSNSIWSSPKTINTTSPIAITTTTSGSNAYECVYDHNIPLPANVTLLGEDPTDTDYYPLISETAGGHTFVYWGYDPGMTTMTTNGANLFINACHYAN